MMKAKDPRKDEFSQFDAPIPGESLTDELGSRSWERPPRFNTPEEVLDMITGKLEKDPERMDTILEAIMAGAAIETVVNTIALEGFRRGEWTPDVAELTKPPLALFLLDKALEKGIPVQFFNEDVENMGKDKQVQRLKMMKDLRPEMYEALEKEVMEVPEEETMMMEEPPMMNMGGFISKPRKGYQEGGSVAKENWETIARSDPKVKAWYRELRAAHPDIPAELDIVDFMKEGMSGPEGYDYKTALESGIRPEFDEESGELHWSSRSNEGVLLKGPKHKTLNKELELNPERNFSPAFNGMKKGGYVQKKGRK